MDTSSILEELKPKPKFLISFRTYGRARINGGYTETRIIEGSVIDWWKNEDNWRLSPSDGIDGCTILMVHELKEQRMTRYPICDQKSMNCDCTVGEREQFREIGDLNARINELKKALEKSVKLQSHYAELLNICDGGSRICFKDAEAWLERLRQLRDNAS